MGLRIRPAEAGDVETLVANNEAMARETEHLTLERERLRHGVSAVLQRPALGFYLVAEWDARIVGQLLVTFEWSDWRNGLFWWIQSVYVAPAFRGRKVYTGLYEHVGRLAREHPEVCGLRLYVEESNRIARRVYESLDMQRTSYVIYETDFVMPRNQVDRDCGETG